MVNQISILRIKKGLTQIDLAKLAGVTQATISQLENGTRKVGGKLKEKLSAILGDLPKDYLKDEIYFKLKKLNPKQAESVLAIIDLITPTP